MTTPNDANSRAGRSASVAPLPSAMPRNNSHLHQQVLAGIIKTKPASWTRKVLAKDADGKEVVNTVSVTYEDALQFPLAQNISEENVERAARRWM